MLLKAKNWTELVKSVPNSVEKIMDEPLICQLVKQVGKESLQQLLEAQIIILANQMNVSNNVNATQVPFIAETLLDTYPTESLADFILVFKRGSIGFYGNTYHKLDCATIMEWMGKHIEKKAMYRERDNTRLKQAESEVKIDYAAYIERMRKQEEIERESKIAAIVKEDEFIQFRENRKSNIDKYLAEKARLKAAIESRGLDKLTGMEGLKSFEIEGIAVWARNKEEAQEIFVEVYI